jgi:choline kinase
MSVVSEQSVCRPPKALVLAAGLGRRLEPETANRPKCLVEVGGASLLEQLLAGLHAVGVNELVMVVGYRQEDVREAVARLSRRPANIEWVENTDFATTNTLESVARAAGPLRGKPFLILNGDLWVQPGELARLVAGPDRTCMLVDRSIRLDEEAMKATLDSEGLVSAVSKQLPIADSVGESIGAYRFSASSGEQFLDAIAERSKVGDRTSFYEAALDAELRRGMRAELVDVTPGTWVEVDDLTDLARARALASKLGAGASAPLAAF